MLYLHGMAEMIGIFVKGGPIMWPILALSVAAAAILIWKALEIKAGRINSKGLTVVSTIITAEPMLGILGTVTGIIRTFSKLGSSNGITDPLAASAGIGEALITTAAGLIVCLVLIFPYNVIAEKVDGREA